MPPQLCDGSTVIHDICGGGGGGGGGGVVVVVVVVVDSPKDIRPEPNIANF